MTTEQKLKTTCDSIEQLTQIYTEEQNKTVCDKFSNLSLEKLDNFTMKNGIHKGKTFNDIFTNQKNYCSWVLRNKMNFRSTMNLFKKYVTRKIKLFIDPSCEDKEEKEEEVLPEEYKLSESEAEAEAKNKTE